MRVILPLCVRSAWRLFRRRPGVHAAIVLILATGIAFSGLGFTMLDRLLGPDVAHPEAVARLGPGITRADGGLGVGGLRLPVLSEIRQQSSTLSEVVGVVTQAAVLRHDEATQELEVAEVTEGFFDLVGVAPRLGRVLQPADARPAAPRVCVLGFEAWQRALGGTDGALGRSVFLDDVPHVVVGVMPRGFAFPNAEAWAPASDPAPDTRVSTWVRLGGDASWPAARAELATIGSRLAREYPDDLRDASLQVRTLDEESRERLGVGTLGLLGPPFVLLLVACLNVAVLLLSEAVRREQEMGIRLSLGAGRAALLRQLLVEGFLLALPAGVLGAVLVRMSVAALRAFAPPTMTAFLAGVDVRPGTFAFLGLLTLLTPLLFGLAPLVHSLRMDVRGALHATRRGRGGFLRFGFADLAVVLEVAGALGLVVWFAHVDSLFASLSRTRWGFEPRGLYVITIPNPDESARRPPGAERQVLDAVRLIPGVVSATLADHLPSPLRRGERVRPADGSTGGVSADVVATGPAFFETLGVHLLQGQGPTRDGLAHEPEGAVVSRSLARALWPGRDPLGRAVRLGHAADAPTLPVIGVAPDLASVPALPRPPHRIYVPLASDDGHASLILARAAVEDPALPRRLESVLEPRLASRRVAASPFHEFVRRGERDLEAGRFVTRLVGAIGLLTLLLAVAGLFAVAHQAVDAGMKELGIRAALGATPGDLLRLVSRRGIAETAIGGTIALSVTLWGLSVGFSDALHVGVGDPRVWMGTLVALAAPLLGGLVPARRAARIDPARVIREE